MLAKSLKPIRDNDIRVITHTHIDGIDRPLFNSIGQAIHATEDGIRNFWKWFGDSKIVDEQGRPLVVYHGTASLFKAFDTKKVGNTFGIDDAGFYFTSLEDEAEKWAQAAEKAGIRNNRSESLARVMPVYLALNMPWNIYANTSNETGKSPVAHFESGNGVFNRGQQNTVQYAVSSGYDGLVVRDTLINDMHEAMFVAFHPEKIKSARDNYGSFNVNTADIFY